MDKKIRKNKKIFPLALLAAVICFLILTPSFTMAGSGVKIKVKSILASTNGNSIDPGLKGLVNELQFRYSSYKSLGEKSLRLTPNGRGSVSFPGQGMMNLVMKGIEGDRVVLDIEIIKNGTRILQTSIKLLNNKSFNIGGPSHKDGTLIFNISASF